MWNVRSKRVLASNVRKPNKRLPAQALNLSSQEVLKGILHSLDRSPGCRTARNGNDNCSSLVSAIVPSLQLSHRLSRPRYTLSCALFIDAFRIQYAIVLK